jgi:hypothetical protein
VTARLFRTAAVAIGGLLMVGVSFGAVATMASAGPGDPTASECAVIAEQARLNNRTPQEQLTLSGGGVCDFVLAVTVVPATKAPATAAPVTVKAVAGSGLPKAVSNIGAPIALGSAAIVVGASILLIARRRKTVA